MTSPDRWLRTNRAKLGQKVKTKTPADRGQWYRLEIFEHLWFPTLIVTVTVEQVASPNGQYARARGGGGSAQLAA